MIIRLPAPKDKKGQPGDIWAMVHVYRCYECCEQWSMAEEDPKPNYCPYCGANTARGDHRAIR